MPLQQPFKNVVLWISTVIPELTAQYLDNYKVENMMLFLLSEMYLNQSRAYPICAGFSIIQFEFQVSSIFRECHQKK